MIPRLAATRLLCIAALALLAYAACSTRHGSGDGRVYIPHADQGAPRCNRWRGDDWLPCALATLTTEARTSSTPTATYRPWASRTPALPLTGGPLTSARIEGRAGHCAPMADGCMTAAHVLRGARRVVIGGRAVAWSVDPTRDLAHALALADASVALRAARVGELLQWSNPRASGSWRVVGASGGAVTVCSVDGWVVWGDSGSGGYAVDDGALVGILTNADLGQGWQASWLCESGQQGRLESLP